MLHIAILEPQRQLAEAMMDWLASAGHEYSCCSELSEFIACVSQAQHDLLLVDLSGEAEHDYPQLEAVTVREDGRIPLLFISEPNAEQEIVAALKHGADDYIVKPFAAGELLARIQVLVRRFIEAQQAAKPKVEQYGPFLINHEQHLLERYGQAIPLTEKDFKLAAYLFSHQNQLLSRHRLLSEVWGLNQELNTRTVDMHISRLRKSLSLADTGFEIKTVHQHGYSLQYTPDLDSQ